jgi:hypothetical protein
MDLDVMDDLYWVYGTALVVVLYLLAHLLRRRFDPFAPVWLFLVGYIHIYVLQAASFHAWAVDTRGADLVWAANFRAFWALLWLLAAYHFGPGRMVARIMPAAPRGWPPSLVAALSPPLVLWGLFCAGLILLGRGAGDEITSSGETSILRAFPVVMLIAAIMLIVTGRRTIAPRPLFLAAGLTVVAAYILIWIYNGRRSHALMAVLTTVCAFYVARLKRPSWPVLLATSFAGALVVAVAIGWRNNPGQDRSFRSLLNYMADFKAESILDSLNLRVDENELNDVTHESDEYGGFLLMMDTVPEKSPFDYGASYLRAFSTFIPRIIWPTKPLYGRSQWVNAWIEGSKMERDEEFTGPAIGILGATQLNGGALGVVIVLGCVATLLRAAYEYFRLHAETPWAQSWWALSYYNAWFMVVNDDPLVWFYYNWGITTLPIIILMWWGSKFSTDVPRRPMAAAAGT